MSPIQTEDLLLYGDLVARLTQLSETAEGDTADSITVVLREMADLLESVVAQVPGGVSNSRIEYPTDASPGLVQSSASGHQEIEAVRMRMVCVLMMGLTDPSRSQSQAIDAEVGSVVTTTAGLTYGRVGKHCVALLPAFESPTQAALFGRDMLEVHDGGMKSEGIILDCSAVKKFSFVSQAIALGYKHNFTSIGKSFSVVWLHRKAVSQPDIMQVCRAFNAEMIGDYLFCKRE